MKISKAKLYSLLGWAIGLALYVFLVFMISKPENRTAAFWIGFSFSIIAILLTLVVVFGGLKANKLLFDYPKYKLCISYCALQGMFSFVFVIFVITGVTWVLVVEVLMLAIFAILFLTLGASNEIILKQEQEVKQKRQVINELKDKVDYLNHKIQDETISKALDKLAEEIRFSDPMSNDVTVSIDQEIESKIDALSTLDETSIEEYLKTLDDLSFLIKQRNTKLKNSK